MACVGLVCVRGQGVARGSGGLWVLGMATSHDVLIDSTCHSDC